MKPVEVKVRLNLPVVAPLLDLVKSVADSLRQELAAPLRMNELDGEFRESWRAELLASQNADVRTLLALFDREFFTTGVISFTEANAEAIVRACSAVRLRLRERYLAAIEDEQLESGEVDLATLAEPVRKAFFCYLFLASPVQELIIRHLDSSILDS